jgi:hypothetical protein
MAWTVSLFLASAVGLTFPDVKEVGSEPASPKKQEQLAKTKLVAARQTYEAFCRNRDYSDVEIAYRWSCRWLEAQRQLSDKQEDWVAAYQGHRERMRDLEQLTRRLSNKKIITIDQVHAAGYYVAEAEVWLLQTKEYGREGQAARR